MVQMSKEAGAANNLSFMFADLIETMLMVAESEFKKSGRAMRHDHKFHFKALLKHAKELKRVVSTIGLDKQVDWADDIDDLLKLILLFVDRTGNNEKINKLFIKYIESFPSKENLDIKKFGV